jgi:hypothetical protein
MIGSIKSDDPLVEVTDYSSLPSHECAPGNLQDLISIGPGLSVREHIGAEARVHY